MWLRVSIKTELGNYPAMLNGEGVLETRLDSGIELNSIVDIDDKKYSVISLKTDSRSEKLIAEVEEVVDEQVSRRARGNPKSDDVQDETDH